MDGTLLHKGNRTSGLFGATLGFFIGFAAVSLFGPTVKYLRASVGLSAALAGLLISIPNLSGSLLRIPFAAWTDKDGGRKPFLVLLILSVIGVFGIWLIMIQRDEVIARLFPLLLVFGVLGGCGIATFSVGIGQTSYWFPRKEQGTALGTYAGLGNLAPGLFALILTAFTLPLFGLANSYLFWLIFLVIGTGLYFYFGRNAWYFQYRANGAEEKQAIQEAKKHGQELFPKGNATESLIHSAKIPETWLLVMVYFTTFGGFLALTAWLPQYAENFLGLPLAAAGIVTAVYSMGASILRVFGGKFSDRIGGETAALISLTIALAGAVIVALSSTTVPGVTGLVLLAIGMGVGNAAVFKMVPAAVPDAVGGAAGWVGGLGAFGGFVIPLVLSAFLTDGLEMDAGYAQGFWVFAALFLISLAVVGILKQRIRSKKLKESQ